MHLDFSGLNTLWARIGEVFARKTEAGGSLAWNSPSLTLKSVAGGTLNTVNLNDGLATDAEAGHSLSFNSGNGNVTLKNVNGGNLSSVDLDTRYATRRQAASTLSRDGNTLYLKDVDGGTNSTVSLPAAPDVSGFVGRSSVFSSARASKSGDTVTITFYDANGNYKDSVSFSVA